MKLRSIKNKNLIEIVSLLMKGIQVYSLVLILFFFMFHFVLVLFLFR